MTQVMDSILGMALQLPALKSIGESIGVDLSSAVGPSSRRTRPGGPAPQATRRCRRADAGRRVIRHPAPQHRRRPCPFHVATSSPRLPASPPAARFRSATRFAQGAPIKLGSVLDNSGNLDAYGKPMVHGDARWPPRRSTPPAACSAARSRSSQYDTQSDIALYTKYAQQLARDDKVDVVHGGITSASREAIRQTFRRANILYFYNVLYEGGVCDRNCFVTGTTPAQAVEPIVEIAMKQWGKKVYVLAADYNYGQITAKWVAHYVKQRGGTVLQDRLLPARRRRLRLDHRQDPGRPSPTSVCAALVGGAHLSFFRQWAASGMNKKIPLFSTTFGVGNEHLALSPAEGDGILIAGNYSQEEHDAGEQGLPRALGASASATPRSCTRSRSRSTRASSCGPRRSRRPARSTARS